MKKYLQYIDGASDKFWQIETSGNSLTVTYGKNGASGQSQTKAFPTEESCLTEAGKLIAGKLKKGYSDDGQVGAIVQGIKSPKQNDFDLVLEEYTHLIKTGNLPGLFPFLTTRAKGHSEELKRHIRKAKTYWLTWVDLSEDNLFKHLLIADGRRYGTRASPVQTDIIVLSAIALFNKNEITSWDEALRYFDRLAEPETLRIIEWSKPAWVNAFLLEKILKNNWVTVQYESLRKLEEKEIIPYNAELFSRSLAWYNSWNRKLHPLPTDYIDYLVNDKVAYQRDVLELFNYETPLQNQLFEDPETKQYNTLILWERIFNRLLSEDKIDRLWFIENCILIQTKEWNAGLRSFFRKRLADLQATNDEILAFQPAIFACLHAPLNAVTNFGIDLIRKVYDEKAFDFDAFLDSVEPVMMRTDCKGGIKTVLGMFDQKVRKQPELKPKISYLTADVFVIADLSIQERAFKTLQKAGDTHDLLLREKLTMYTPQMQGNMSSTLSIFLDHEAPEGHETSEQYTPTTINYTFLSKENKVKLFENWNELLFHFGKFISSSEPLDAELILNALITQQDLFPDNAFEQLAVYSKQIQKNYSAPQYKDFIFNYLVHFIEQKSGNYRVPGNRYRNSQVVYLMDDLLLKIQKKIKAKSTIPMLSFPTHSPHWIAPKILVERLVQYKNAGEPIDAVDFAIAISRTRRENTSEALALCAKLDTDTEQLMRFCLGETSEMMLPKNSFLGKLFSGKTSLLDHSYTASLWAVAARTFDPDGVFPQFEKSHLKAIPNVGSPFLAKPEIILQKSKWKNYFNNETSETVWKELNFELPKFKQIHKCLLYSLDLSEPAKDSWVYNILSMGNTLFWHSIMPQNDESLSTIVLKYQCKNDQETGKDILGFLQICSSPEFRFTDTSLMVLACCTMRQVKEVRAYTGEVIIFLIEHKRLDVKAFGKKLSYLICEGYAPLQRSLEVLLMIRDISVLHNSALVILFNSILENFELKDKLPTHFKKLLESYFDLLAKTKNKPGDVAKAKLLSLNEQLSLKSIIKQIEGIS